MKDYINVFKKDKLLNMMSNSLKNLPIPISINVWWNFGSMLGLFLLIQILSGFLLSMHYCPNVSYAFQSIVHIMKDVNYGWLMRAIHMNGASFYFILMYVHVSRNLYYNSFMKGKVWFFGVSIMLLSMMTAFMGYVLPWGQMSYWGATVITNLMSAFPLGEIVVMWIWGGYSISNPTLNRFFSMHFLLPFVILLLVLFHLLYLHMEGSSDTMGLNSKNYMIPFHPYFTLKDFLGFILLLMFFMMLILINPYYLGDPDNFKMYNWLKTPHHIKPEWYFLFAYSILRSIPNKMGGVIALVMSIMILYIMPLYKNFYNMKGSKFYPINKCLYWLFINNFILLTWLGGQFIQYPYYLMNIYLSIFYFSYFLLYPLIANLWDKLIK